MLILRTFRLINYPLTIGVPVVVLPKFIDTLFFSTIQKHKITYAFLVPPIILHLANNPLAQKFDLSSLRNIMSGAAPLGAGLTKKVKQRFPKISVSQGYGKVPSTFCVSPLTFPDLYQVSRKLLHHVMLRMSRMLNVTSARVASFCQICKSAWWIST